MNTYNATTHCRTHILLTRLNILLSKTKHSTHLTPMTTNNKQKQKPRARLYLGARRRSYYQRPSKKAPPGAVALRNKTYRENNAKLEDSASRLAAQFSEMISEEAAAQGIDEDKLLVLLGRKGTASQKTRASGNAFNGFTRDKSKKLNEGALVKLFQQFIVDSHLEVMDEYNRRLAEYQALDDDEKAATSPPELPKLWTAFDIIQNKEYRAEYKNAAETEKADWKKQAEEARDPANNKKASTEANHDTASVNRAIRKMVSCQREEVV